MINIENTNVLAVSGQKRGLHPKLGDEEEEEGRGG